MVLKAFGLRQDFDFAFQHAGFAALTYTPNPMNFLSKVWLRPSSEKPVMIVSVSYADKAAKVPCAAKIKKTY